MHLSKGAKFTMLKWNEEAEEAFQQSKVALHKGAVLTTPKFSQEFHLQTYTFDMGLGEVLSHGMNGEEHPVAYLIWNLTPAERNDSIVKRESLDINCH